MGKKSAISWFTISIKKVVSIYGYRLPLVSTLIKKMKQLKIGRHGLINKKYRMKKYYVTELSFVLLF